MSTASLQVRTERAKQRAGEVLNDKWRLDSVLGVGGTATVYAATHRNGKRAAIKILHRELVANEELLARFLREGYVANKLQHPGAVSILDDDRTEDGAVFLVMELLEGYSLDRHTRRGVVRLSYEHIFQIADETLDVLAAAHAHGVIHRDVKPANIFLQNDGRIKVLDFGIARLTEPLNDGTLTQTGTAIGTPAFMPPEQARGRWNLIDARTDVWALGATMFALVIGERPRRGETVQEELLAAMAAPMPPLVSRAPNVPPEVASVIDRALAFEMDDRWHDARAMQQAVRGLFTSRTPSSIPRSSYAPAVDSRDGSDRGEAPLTPQLTTGRPLTSRGSESPLVPVPRVRLSVLWIGLSMFGIVLAGLGFRWRMRHASPTATSDARVAPTPLVGPSAELPAGTTTSPPAPTPANAPTAPPTGAITTLAVEAGTPHLASGSHAAHPPAMGVVVRSAPTLPPRPSTKPEPKPDGDPFDNRF